MVWVLDSSFVPWSSQWLEQVATNLMVCEQSNSNQTTEQWWHVEPFSHKTLNWAQLSNTPDIWRIINDHCFRSLSFEVICYALIVNTIIFFLKYPFKLPKGDFSIISQKMSTNNYEMTSYQNLSQNSQHEKMTPF